jgi:predicted deacylase
VPFLGVSARPGEIARARGPVAELVDGTPVTIPVVVIRGAQPGPTLYVQAGLHGDEATGIEICRRALPTIDPATLSGTVVSVPLANVPAHQSRTRGFLHEERWLIDINRIFPGSAGGLLTERLAHTDLSIDLHSALDGCEMAPHAYVDPADDETGTLTVREQAALAFGTPYVYYKARGAKVGTSDMSRSLGAQADAARRAMISTDMGESRRVSAHLVPMGVRGIHNTLRVLGMEKGQPEVDGAPRRFSKITIVHATRGGGLRLSVELGAPVVAGQAIGEIVDVFGQTVEQIASPVAGFVLRVMRLASVSTGAEVVWLAS